MKAKRQVQQQLKRDYRRYKRRIAGILGDYSGTVDVPNRVGYVFVRLRNQEVKEAFNKRVPSLIDLPVWVGYSDDPGEPQILQVLDTRTGVERQKGEDPIGLFIPAHHETHEWFNPLGGQDVVFSDKRQFMPFRPTPIGGMLLHVYRNVGWLNGEYTFFSGSSIDLSPYVPNTGAYFGLVYEDTDATLSFSSGTGDFLKNAFTLTLADIPNPTPGTYPIAAVRMWGGMTGIVEALDRTDLIDLRFPFTQNFLLLSDVPWSYTGSASQLVSVKSDETGLEFISSAGITGGFPSTFLGLTDTPSSYSGQATRHVRVNPGATALEFVDAPSGGGDLVIYDDSVFKVTGTAISFDDNLDVSVTGSIAYVNSSGGGANHSYYTKLAALLEPDAIEPLQLGAFSYAVGASETKYLLYGWQIRVGAAGTLVIRDPRNPLPLRDITITGIFNSASAKSTAVIIDPTLPTYSDARDTYFDRLDAITTYDTKYLGISGTSQTIPFLSGAYGAIITHVTSNDLAWVALFGPRDGVFTAGYPIDYEIGDAQADHMRFAHNMFLPVDKKIVSTVQSGAGDSADGQMGGAITYVLLPSTWSAVSDPLAPYDFRDDFMGSSLDTAVTWNVTGSLAGNVEIDTQYQWCRIIGNGVWGANGMFSKSSISRASGTAYQVDAYLHQTEAQTNLIMGFHDGAGYSYTDFAHGVYFYESSPGNRQLHVFENGTSRGDVGSGWDFANIYRIRITLENNAAKYEIQGGADYPAIGSNTWTNITPGTTSSATTPLHAGASKAGSLRAYLSDMKIYDRT